MRSFFALTLLLLYSTTALAEARLKISSDRSVVIVVNLVPHPMTGAKYEEAVIEIPDGKEGLQNIRVLNALGQEQWKGQVLVQKNQVVKAQWKGRQFKVTDRRNMVNPTYGRKSPTKRQVAGHQVLDDLASSNAIPKGEDDVLAALAAAKTTEESPEDTDSAEGTAPSSEVTEGPAGPVVAGQPGKLELVNRTSSWANAYVDGKLVHEFRGDGNRFMLELSTGEHQVQFRDFQDRQDWGDGTITVYPDFVVELHFGMAEPPTAFNRKEAWVPASE